MSEDRIQRKIEHLTGIIRLARATLDDAERELANVAAAVWDALDGAPEPELFPGTNAALDRLAVRKAAPAEAFCIETATSMRSNLAIQHASSRTGSGSR